jgi:hypothetical protein
MYLAVSVNDHTPTTAPIHHSTRCWVRVVLLMVISTLITPLTLLVILTGTRIVRDLRGPQLVSSHVISPLVAELNDRFASGHASNDLSIAGVVMRQFDGLEDMEWPWTPCLPRATCSPLPSFRRRNTTWEETAPLLIDPLFGQSQCPCQKLVDRVPATVVNQKVPRLFLPSRGGIVVDAGELELLCSYATDGSSSLKVCSHARRAAGNCTPGCFDSELSPKLAGWCYLEGDEFWYTCAFAPDQLIDMLQQQAHTNYDGERLADLSHNEVRVCPRSGIPNSDLSSLHLSMLTHKIVLNSSHMCECTCGRCDPISLAAVWLRSVATITFSSPHSRYPARPLTSLVRVAAHLRRRQLVASATWTSQSGILSAILRRI